MNNISYPILKFSSAIIFVLLIISTYYLLIPKNIFFLFLKLIFLIPTIILIVNLVNLVPKNLFYLLSKIFAFLGMVVLLVVSYNSSKRKPDDVSELYTDFTWLINWPKWLDTPFMHWINSGWRGFIADYGVIFDAIGYGLLRGYTELKNVIVQAPWPVVIIGVIAITYFTSGRKVGTTAFVGFCTFFIGFLNPRFWDKAIETTTMVVIGIAICIVIGILLVLQWLEVKK